MKQLKHLARNFLNKLDRKIELPADINTPISAVLTSEGLLYLKVPMPRHQMICPHCGGSNGKIFYLDDVFKTSFYWFCTKAKCLEKFNKKREHEQGL